MYMYIFESVSPEHEVVRRELYRLLSWRAGNGVLVQESSRTTRC